MSKKITISLGDNYLNDLVEYLKANFVISMSDEELKGDLVAFIKDKIVDWVDSELYNLVSETYPDKNGLEWR